VGSVILVPTIDWPNLIAGAIIGFLLALIPWMIDRRSKKRERAGEAWTAWMAAAKQIEFAAKPESTAADLYLLRVSYPVDLWRSILGPRDFLLLETLEASYMQVEGMARLFQESPTPENQRRVEAALLERRSAFIAFANMARAMQDESYQVVVFKEDRQRLRRDYARHPVRTWKRERHNRKARRG
jgi:hypothetical protein